MTYKQQMDRILAQVTLEVITFDEAFDSLEALDVPDTAAAEEAYDECLDRLYDGPLLTDEDLDRMF